MENVGWLGNMLTCFCFVGVRYMLEKVEEYYSIYRGSINLYLFPTTIFLFLPGLTLFSVTPLENTDTRSTVAARGTIYGTR